MIARSSMRLRSGKTVESIFVFPTSSNANSNVNSRVPFAIDAAADVSDDGNETTETDEEDDEDVSNSDEEFYDGREEIVSRAFDDLDESMADTNDDQQPEGETTSTDKITLGKERELVANISTNDILHDLNNNICNGKLRDVSSSTSCLNIGSGIQLSYKRVGGHFLVRLAVNVVKFLTSLSYLIKPYTKASSTHKSENKRAYKGMQTRHRSKEASLQQASYHPKRSYIRYMIHIVNVMVLLLVLWKFSHHFDALPNPRKVGLDNCNEITLPLSSRIHAWHILPPSSENLSISEALYQGLPIVFHARNAGVITAQHRVNVLKALSLNNYHVVAPVAPLSHAQTLQVWSHLSKLSNNSVVYAWFDDADVNTIKTLASTMCSIGHAPMGIVLETKKMADIRFHSMDIWSSSCKTKEQKEIIKFNFLKCPISTQSVDLSFYEDVSSCLQSVATSTSVEY